MVIISILDRKKAGTNERINVGTLIIQFDAGNTVLQEFERCHIQDIITELFKEMNIIIEEIRWKSGILQAKLVC